MNKIYKRTGAITVLLFSYMGIVLANPELGNDGPIHFVLNQNNADWEYKTDSGQCDGGVVPQGDGTAWGQITCRMNMYLPPWHNVPDIKGLQQHIIDGNLMQGTPCEMFDSSNNAGNNQGHNVTQYNSNNWAGVYRATRNDNGTYDVVMTNYCFDGVAQ